MVLITFSTARPACMIQRMWRRQSLSARLGAAVGGETLPIQMQKLHTFSRLYEMQLQPQKCAATHARSWTLYKGAPRSSIGIRRSLRASDIMTKASWICTGTCNSDSNIPPCTACQHFVLNTLCILPSSLGNALNLGGCSGDCPGVCSGVCSGDCSEAWGLLRSWSYEGCSGAASRNSPGVPSSSSCVALFPKF